MSDIVLTSATLGKGRHFTYQGVVSYYFREVLGAGLSSAENWRVILGEHNQANPDGTEQILAVERIVKHPDFICNNFINLFLRKETGLGV